MQVKQVVQAPHLTQLSIRNINPELLRIPFSAPLLQSLDLYHWGKVPQLAGTLTVKLTSLVLMLRPMNCHQKVPELYCLSVHSPNLQHVTVEGCTLAECIIQPFKSLNRYDHHIALGHPRYALRFATNFWFHSVHSANYYSSLRAGMLQQLLQASFLNQAKTWSSLIDNTRSWQCNWSWKSSTIPAGNAHAVDERGHLLTICLQSCFLVTSLSVICVYLLRRLERLNITVPQPRAEDLAKPVKILAREESISTLKHLEITCLVSQRIG